MSIKKNLDPSDKSFTTFTVNKKFSFTERDSGSGIFAVPIIRGTDANLYNFLKSTATSKTSPDPETTGPLIAKPTTSPLRSNAPIQVWFSR